MFTKRKVRKLIAVFLLLNFIYDLALPSIAVALTAGPTAPEYTSFEPVDTTDMVNMATGDFTYNIPLLEVPGPEGGYPLSLSYHAGIQPGEEASWVGLGWTLNPGAITRTVNGYPDDHNGAQRIVNDSWEGGDRTTFSVGVGLAGANLSLAFSQDTYQGFGVGGRFGYGFQIGPIGINANYGIGAYGGTSGNISASILAANISTDFNSTSVGLSAYGGSFSKNLNTGTWNTGLMGISISSDNLKPSLSIAGLSINQVNSNAGGISQDVSSFGFIIPIGYLTVSLGYNYVRYYSNETSEVNVYGSLHPGFHDPDENSFDSYALMDYDNESGKVDDLEVEKVLGGSMNAFDQYSVTGQGINGNMRPYSFFNGSLFRQNLKKKDSEEYLIKYENKSQPHGGTEFRFINDFSNGSYYSDNFDPYEHLNADNAPKITSNTATGISFSSTQPYFKSEGWKYSQQQLAGSKHIEYFSNQQIADGTAFSDYGFISLHDYNNHRTTVQGYPVADQVGGFMITNESGVTYHYSIPVYAYDEFISSKTIDDDQEEVTNTRIHPHPYAYTWLLTAITGPDYVNRNSNSDGTIGDHDWGYWVEFDYGMWANNYRWRNPESGWHKDIDENIQTFSRGTKELYYLDAIRTRTHTALFVKEMRKDGKGKVEDGYFLPQEYDDRCGQSCNDGFDRDFGTITYYKYPVSTLRLSEIILVRNEVVEDLSIDTSTGSALNHTFRFDYEIDNNECGTCDFNSKYAFVHSGRSVLDKEDIELVRTDLLYKASRVVQFTTDYTLCPQTTNSFSNTDLYTMNPDLSERERSGKLTLKSLKFSGKEGEQVIPSMNFAYDEVTPETGYFTMASKSTKESGLVVLNVTLEDNANIEEGEIIKFKIDTKEFFGVIKIIEIVEDLTTARLNILGQNIPELVSSRIAFQTTKNPPYNSQYTDSWGFYKSDFEELGNSAINKTVSKLSKESLDVWSLRSIETSVGASIQLNYESDKYLKPVLAKNKVLKLSTFEYQSADQFKLSFVEEDIVLHEHFKIGESVDCSVWGYYYYESALLNCVDQNDCEWDQSMIFKNQRAFFSSEGSSKISEIGSDYIIIESNQLKNELNKDKTIDIEYLLGLNCNNVLNSRIPKQCELTFSGDYDFFLGGFLSNGYDDDGIYGGGIRVGSIKVEDGVNFSRTDYSYEKNEKSTGYTVYEPFDILSPNIIVPEGTQPSESLIKSFKNAIIENYSSVIINSRELPSPMVIYQQVKVEEEIQRYGSDPVRAPESRVYEFQVYEEGMNERLVDDCESCTEIWPGKTVTMRDYSSRLGSLKSVSTYDGDDNLITKQVTDYLHDNIDNEIYRQDLAVKYANQGFTSELFNEFRIVEKEDDEGNLQNYNMAVMAVKEVYPSIVTGNTTYNYKTGVTTQTHYLAFDFYSGEVTKSLSTDSYGNRYLTEKTPAYKNYTGMGLAMNGGKNMLTQEGVTYSYKVASDYETTGNKLGLVSASAQTWSDQLSFAVLQGDEADLSLETGIWRKKSNYSWKGDDQSLGSDGLYPIDHFVEFNAWNDEDTPYDQWQKNNEVTLIDVHSHALEAKDLNGQYAATKMDANQEYVFATVANAQYHEFAYTGSEDEVISDGNNLFWGGVYLEEGMVNNTVAHTGSNSVSVAAGNKTLQFNINNPGNDHDYYRASVWTTSTNGQIVYAIDGGTPVSTTVDSDLKSGDWYLINVDIPVEEGSFLSVYCQATGGAANFDDFRVHPLDAAMTSYVYNDWGELSHTLGTNNFYTEYVYDAMGRLREVWTEVLDRELTAVPEGYTGKVRSSKNKIHYARENN
jgi:hypothetical protein